MSHQLEMFNKGLSHKEAVELKGEVIWRNLKGMKVQDAVEAWLDTLSTSTARSYKSAMNMLAGMGLIRFGLDLQGFALVNHENVVDRIKLLPELSEATKQHRAACYISFTGYLSRKTGGVTSRAVANMEGNSKTFFKIREIVKTQAIEEREWTVFLEELDKLNSRDCLAAKLMIQGGKRISEVLDLKVENIDFDSGEITFKQRKTKREEKFTVITYPVGVINALKEYLGGRVGYVFLSQTGNRLHSHQLRLTFAKAGQRAGIKNKVTPHVLRASTVTHLKKMGFSDSEIGKVTGHSSDQMVRAYDKSKRSDNVTKRVCLV